MSDYTEVIRDLAEVRALFENLEWLSNHHHKDINPQWIELMQLNIKPLKDALAVVLSYKGNHFKHLDRN